LNLALVVALVAVLALLCLAWGWFEAGWLRTRVLEVELPGLPVALDGARIAHLSDFHLGPPSRGQGAARKAAEWVAARAPDLVVVTGDLVSHPRGLPELERLLGLLDHPLVVLGNHDVQTTRDPFSRPAEIGGLEGATLLENASTTHEVRGVRVQVAGLDPRSYPPGVEEACGLVDETAELRILLCHFPGIARRLPADAYDLVLAGHLHAGQICIPYPGGRLPLAHPRERVVAGIVRLPGTVLHVSPGTGTTFVPFRFFARPEVTELVLRAGSETMAGR
jgi:predicted MPP superfamily phosphohydrolase